MRNCQRYQTDFQKVDVPLLGAWRSILVDCWVSLKGFWGLRTRVHRVFPSIVTVLCNPCTQFTITQVAQHQSCLSPISSSITSKAFGFSFSRQRRPCPVSPPGSPSPSQVCSLKMFKLLKFRKIFGEIQNNKSV